MQLARLCHDRTSSSIRGRPFMIIGSTPSVGHGSNYVDVILPNGDTRWQVE
jgi:hypothetical protein